jgi:putative ABC transport system permease protein
MLLQDIRFAVRSLRRAPVFAVAAVLTIALGIAANTAVFSVVNAVLVRSLPFEEPARLMEVAERNERLNLPYFASSTLNYQSWKGMTRTFERMGAFGFATYTLLGGGEPEQVTGGPISPALVPLLGLRPLAGRAFREGEDTAGSPPVVLIGEALWKRRFGADRAAVGQPVTVDGRACTLVGVMGPELTLLTGGELWMPMVIDATRENRLSHVITAVGRLRRGVSMETAQAEMDGIGRRVVEQYPDVRDWTIRIRPLSKYLVSDQLRTAVLVLMGAVVLVLLIVCANVANLLLARAVGRQKELAIRTAMGASRARLVRQLLTEGVLLSLAGGVIGVLMAGGAVDLFNAIPTAQRPVAGVRIDAAVLLFSLGASVLTGLLFGVAPAWHGSRANINVVLQQGSRSSRSHARPLLRHSQAAAQLVLATVLVIGAGLLAQSLWRLQRVPVGFDTERVLTFRVALPPATYPDHTASWAFYKRLIGSLETLPGVRGVAISSGLPFGAGAYTRTPMSTPSRSVMPSGTQIPIDWRVVSPGYFKTLGIPLLAGRDFTDMDSPASEPVMIVTRAFARKYWGDDDPVGKVVHLVNARGKQRADYTVVGMVGDTRNVTLTEELPTVYYSSSWRLWPSMEVAVRTAGPPEGVLPAARGRIRALDPGLPISAVQTMDQAMSASASQPRFNALLLVAFAGIALLIAAIGIYGVLAYSVSQRVQEIGVRMALGAERGTVMRLIVGQGLTVALAGVGVGLALAAAASRVLASLLFGVDARDPFTFGAGAVVLTVVAVAACAVPAWRASRVDPVVALRAE